MSACRDFVVEPIEGHHAIYERGLTSLAHDGVPFLAGGALALAAYAGIRRNTKDLDLFVRERDVPRVLEVLAHAGFRTETPYPHWLAKGYAGEHFIDVIFSSGNGIAPVDDEWFEHAVPAVVFGTPVSLCPVEETIWSKSFVMERERYDGADVAHLLFGSGETLDWKRLLRRFGPHWRVLLSHLILFGYVYPDDASRIPSWVMNELVRRLRRDERALRARASPPRGEPRVCRGTLLSREQYLPDLAQGCTDARQRPAGPMSDEHIATWTEAIGRSK
ncbi:MAG TPA: nucleotidyltransferase family protein [Polyangiaceae bacterium]|nr:nucleotidyltransferase family protein [Polyangiaceae bacterium]